MPLRPPVESGASPVGNALRGVPRRLPAEHTSKIHWRIAPGWEERLGAADSIDLARWLRPSGTHVIKRGGHRVVYRLDIGGNSYFLKHYRASSWSAKIWQLIAGSTSRREWRKSVEVARRRIATAVPVALGESRKLGLIQDSFLMTQAVPNSFNLDHYAAEILPRLPRDERLSIRRGIVAELARLCAAAHRAGICHQDFHSANILIQVPSAGSLGEKSAPRLFLIDLASVQLSRPLGWRRCRDNLVMLHSAFWTRSTEAERRRFWRLYMRNRPELSISNPRQAGSDIVRRAWIYKRAVLRSRDVRALRTNQEFQVLATAEAQGHAIRELTAADFESWAAISDSKSRAGDGLMREAHELSLAGKPTPVDCSTFPRRSWLGRFGKLWGTDPAQHRWQMGHALLKRGISTPRPIAYGKSTAPGQPAFSFLATERLSGVESFEELVRGFSKPNDRGGCRSIQQAQRSLGQLIGRMHSWHFRHPNLTANDVQLTPHSQGTTAHLVGIDGVSLVRRLPETARAQDLARLATNFAHLPGNNCSARLRFLKAYQSELPQPTADWKQLWCLIARQG